MLVKKVLIFLPTFFVLFLLSSIFWVPKADDILNDPGRLNRHIIYLPGDVASMNPWLSGSATDSDVTGYIFESLFGSDGDFKLEYELCERAEIREEVVVHLDAGSDAAAIQTGLSAYLKEHYPETFDRVAGPDEYRKDWHTGWDDGQYVIDRSGDKELKSDAIPDDDRFMAPYRPEAESKVSDGIKRLVIFFKPSLEGVDFSKNDIPLGIEKDIGDKLDDYFKDHGKDGFVKAYNAKMAALNWYREKNGLEPFALTPPTIEAEQPEEEGEGPDNPDGDDDSSDGDGTESAEDKDEETKPTEDNGSEESKEGDAEGKKEESPKFDDAAVKKLLDAQFPALAAEAAKANAAVKGFESALRKVLHDAIKAHGKEPKASVIPDWTKAAFEKLGAAIKEADEAGKTKKAGSFSDYFNTAPKVRFLEFPVVKMRLREGVKWHDYGTKRKGGPRDGELIEETLDTGDVAFSYAFGHHDDVNSKRKTYSNSIQQIRIFSDYEFEFAYKRLYSPAIRDLAAAQIIPEHRFRKSDWVAEAVARNRGPERAEDANDEKKYAYRKEFPATLLNFQRDPIGTGPMFLHGLNGDLLPKWRSGELVRLERFDEYWDPKNKPVFQYLDFYIFDPDLGQETAEVVFTSGGTDIYGVRPHQVEKFEADRSDYYLYKRGNLTYEYIAFNLKNEHFKDIRVRQALTMAVDVQKIVDYVVYGQARRVNQPAYPILPYYNDAFIPDYTFIQGPNKGKSLKEAGLNAFPFDMAEAAALLKEAGYEKNSAGNLEKDGKVVKFTILNGGAGHSTRGKIAFLAMEQWKKLGIDVSFEGKEFNVFLSEHIYPRKFDCVTLGWSGGTSFDKRQLWHSKYLTPGGLNFINFDDKESDQIMEDLLKEYSEEKQIELQFKLNARIANQCPYVFLFSNLSTIAVSRSLYWAKPVVDEDGNPVLNDQGLVEREKRSMVDPELMSYKYGPRINRMQFARSKDVEYEASDKESYIVGDPKRKWGERKTNSKEDNEE